MNLEKKFNIHFFFKIIFRVENIVKRKIRKNCDVIVDKDLTRTGVDSEANLKGEDVSGSRVC